MSYPDEFLHPWQVGLPELNRKAHDLITAADDDSVDAFVRLMLAGRVTHELSPRRVILNALQGIPTHSAADIRTLGDFDSLIGFTQNLPFRTHISVLPIPLFNRTLTKNVHVKVQYIDRHVGLERLIVCRTLTSAHDREIKRRNSPTK